VVYPIAPFSRPIATIRIASRAFAPEYRLEGTKTAAQPAHLLP
jgi:hypothetical protein